MEPYSVNPAQETDTTPYEGMNSVIKPKGERL